MTGSSAVSWLHRYRPGASLFLLAVLVCAVPCAAQESRPSPIAIDTVVSVDESRSETGDYSTGVVMDAVATIGMGHGLEAVFRPWVQRLASTGEWNRQIWIATVRYEREGNVGLRVDAGLIPSPVGLANLLLRPQLNPTISLPSSLFQPLPAMQFRGPRATLLGAVYPYGASATVSGTHWDARAAIIDSSPVRTRRVFAQTNPPRFANVVVGGGVTPIVGVRVGASVTHGGWQEGGESPTITVDRDATIVTVESDVAFRHTHVMGEWTRDALETANGDQVATGWWVLGQQMLTPRWFVAGRIDQMSAPALTAPGTLQEQDFAGTEETVGFRLTPEITLRGGHRARRAFGRTGFDDQISVSVVWWKRWM